MSLYDELQERLNNVHVYSGYFMSDCPFHKWESHNQPFMIHPDAYKCLSCGAYGTLEKLSKYLGEWYHAKQSDRKSRRVLPRWRRWENDYGDVTGIAKQGHGFLERHPEFMGFFRHRGIDQFFEQGFFGYIDGWYLFPVFDQKHHIVDVVVRAWKGKGDARYVLRPDSLRQLPYLYCPDWGRINTSQHIYIVYGIIDAWSLYAIGLPVITGTTGKSVQSSLIKPLQKYYTVVPDKHEDEAAYRLAGELGFRANVLRLKYPEDCKDPDEVRMNFGADHLKELLTPQGEYNE